MKKRFVSLVLATAMVFSLLTFTAPSAGAYEYVPEKGLIDAFANAHLFGWAKANGLNFDQVSALISEFSFPAVGEVSSYEYLEYCAECYNESFIRYNRVKFDPLYNPYDETHKASVRYDSTNGIYRVYDNFLGKFPVDAFGDFPYFDANKMTGDVPADEDTGSYGARWCSASGSEITNNISRTSYEALSAKQLQLSSEWGHPCSLYKTKIGPKGKEVECWTILDENWYYYCDQNGNRYAAVVEPSVTETVRPSIDNDGNLIEGDNGIILDVEDNVLNLIGQLGDQFQLNIDDMVFDFGTNSYTVNAYTTVNEGDNYYYTYYTYNVQYNITNTYITYIGSNDAYEREEYELYYQLPDGRSSADLTADEIAGMSFEFYDVVNYKRSTDNVSVRGLYHFDGNTDDDSYFTNPNRFTWRDGATITYMESPSSFGGNLYLDNTAHAFTIGMPSNLSVGDFTIQFRYYQASEPDTQSNVENVLSLSASGLAHGTLLKWDEGTLYDRNGSALCALPIGTWNEICVVRHNGQLIYYLNGHCVGDIPAHVVFTKELYFDFGSTSRAYSMLDELRILNFALVENKADYTPTVVPHDSNLVLILPDSERPMADEYFRVVSSKENLFGDRYNFSDGGSLDRFSVVTAGDGFANAIPVDWNSIGYRSEFYSASVADNSVHLTRHSSSVVDTWANYWGFGYRVGPRSGWSDVLETNTDYTFSIVHEDGSVDSLTFNSGTKWLASQERYTDNRSQPIAIAGFDWGQLAYASVCVLYQGGYYYFAPMLCIIPNAGSTVDVSYIELVKGISTDVHVEKSTDVYPGDLIKPNTAAIQTTIPVNGYTVGGIRPTMPAKGDLWFPVMESRITSVQIYTGTHWEEVNARWYTGERWIPIYAFDINTLEDLFDIADGDSTVPLLPDQNSFLRWWQLQWLDFRSWLDGRLSELIAAVGGGGEGIDTETPDDDGNVKFSPLQLIDTILGGLLEIAKEVIVEFVSLVVDLFKMFIQALLDFVGGLVDVLSSGLTHFSTLSDGLSGIGNFVSGTYDAIPDDIQGVLTSSFVVIISVSLLAFLL